MYSFADNFPMMSNNRDKSHHGKTLIVTITLWAAYVKAASNCLSLKIKMIKNKMCTNTKNH